MRKLRILEMDRKLWEQWEWDLDLHLDVKNIGTYPSCSFLPTGRPLMYCTQK
jgi:hypothetical protein